MADIDLETVLDAHRRHRQPDQGGHYCVVTLSGPEPGEECEPYRLAEQMKRWQWEHALANDGCVPSAAYRDVCDELARQQTKVARVEALDESTEWGQPGEGAYVPLNRLRARLRAAIADQPKKENP